MPERAIPLRSTLDRRIESIDAARGIAILLMLFVNDIAGVKGIPDWMKHTPRGADGLTFVDLVFPAFLFIVGMSLPFAIGRRLERGATVVQIWKHILIRTLGLLVIGVFMVNSDSISDKGFLNPHLWTLFMYAGVILVWNVPPKKEGNKRGTLLKLRIIGLFLLVVLVLLYQGKGISGFFQMRTQWWGILGLIGWAYIVSCLFYIPLRRQISGLVGAMAILYCIYMADIVGGLAFLSWIKPFINVSYMLGSHSAIVISGAILSMILTPDSPVKGHKARIRWATVYGLGLALAGFLLHSLHDIHEMFIVNKILATPPWCLLCSAVYVGIWVALYWLIDVRGMEEMGSDREVCGCKRSLCLYSSSHILRPICTSRPGFRRLQLLR
jgi:heparan-alpha-glucosaminide N-acetyltransferase